MKPSPSSSEMRSASPDRGREGIFKDKRLLGFFAFAAVLSVLFVLPLAALVRHALKEELHSHILLIPFVSIYLASLKRGALPAHGKGMPLLAVMLTLLATAVFVAPWLLRIGITSHNDQLAQWAVCYVLLLWAGASVILGVGWMRVLMFPLAFLVFMIPMPDAMVIGFEHFLMRVSAVVADWLFQLSGTPIHRTGQVIELPGMTLEVAQECSGIRSTWVLLITSLIASYLFLSSPWHRSILVGLVIPLGILRNGVRVLVIGLLCVHQGTHMIDSWVHHHGGPVFFVASLIPLLVMAAWFHRKESRAEKGSDSSAREG